MMTRSAVALISVLCGCAMSGSSGAPSSSAAPEAAPSSGGTSVETAERVSRGQTVEGVVVDATPRYYQVQLQAAETLQLGFYTHCDQGARNATIAVLDQMGGKLKEQMVTVSSTSDWDVNKVSFTAQTAGSYLIRAACYKCLNYAVRYRIAIQ